MPQEIWKDIPIYVGRYQASNLGRIKNIQTNHIMKQQIDIDGYFIVSLEGLKKRTYKVHRLVAMTFIPNPLNKAQINHIDGNKKNNVITNLEWVTPRENIKHAYKIGIYSRAQHSRAQDKHKKSVLKMENGNVVSKYESLSQAAKMHNVKKQSILFAIKKNRKSCGYYWCYEQEKAL